MKKWTKKLVCLLCAVITVFSGIAFTACNVNETVINAYDVAVKNGFQGTEEEWLLSLNGKNGEDGKDLTLDDLYTAAKAEGFTGSKLDFIQSLTVNYHADNDTKTVAKNVTSVVSIFCGFKQTKNNYFQGQYEKITSSGGSGVIMELNKEAGSAYIVTNYHVIYSAESDTGISENIYLYPYGELVYFNPDTGKDESGYGIKATFIGGAMNYDIALLKVEGSEKLKNSALTAAELGNSNSVKVGAKTFAIGNSNGLGLSVTGGLLSVDSEMIYLSSFDGKNRNIAFRVMRTDASVNHGNSGGGLFDINGKLIGITNAKNVEEETDNICYALPITLVKYLMENIRDNMQSNKAGYVSCATVGIQTRLMESSVYLDEQGELALKERFYVDKVTEGSAADGVLKPMDIIQSITINGVTTELTRRYIWNDLLLTIRKGDSVQITVLRDSKTEDKKEEVVLTLTFNRDSDFVKFA